MKQGWESGEIENADEPKRVRAIAYYRHSAQDRQENSIPIQRDQVREWASKNGVEIIHEFADAGKSEFNSEDRPAFTEMMEEWVTKLLSAYRWQSSVANYLNRNPRHKLKIWLLKMECWWLASLISSLSRSYPRPPSQQVSHIL